MNKFVYLCFVAACSAGSAPASDMGNQDSGKPPAPTTLRSFESNAEGISDAAKLSDWTKVQGILLEAQNTWSLLKPQMIPAGAKSEQLKAIDDLLTRTTADLTAKAQRAVETDGNTISLAVPDLFDLFSYPVPSDALRGDGVFRQLQIEAEYSDWIMAAADLANVKQVWARLKPMVVARAPMRPDIAGSATLPSDLDAAIMRADTALAAHDSAAEQTAAQNGLDLVDLVEQIFK